MAVGKPRHGLLYGSMVKSHKQFKTKLKSWRKQKKKFGEYLSRDKLLGSRLIYHLLCHLAESLQTIRNLRRDQWVEQNNLIRLKMYHMTRYGTSPPSHLSQPHMRTHMDLYTRDS